MAAMDTINERAPSATGLEQASVSAANAVAVATNLLTSAMNVPGSTLAISPEQLSHFNSFLRQLDCQLGPVITVNITFLSGKTFVVVVPKKEPICWLMKRIENKTGIPWNEQRLIFLGQNLSPLVSRWAITSFRTMHIAVGSYASAATSEAGDAQQ